MAAATLPADRSRRFWALAALGAAVVLAGLGAAHYMEVHGHAVTGMNNQVVWGLPHVFAIFMIVAASGVLNVASVGSVFGEAAYKPHAPLSGLLSLALLAGGLAVLMLDLGRPDRMIVAATHYNFTSVFAWNVFLYSGMFALVAVYLWTSMERRMGGWSGRAGLAVFVWRLVLTTGTGMIFAFLVARPAYGSALLPPLFVLLSLAWGLAVFLLAQAALAAASGSALPDELHRRLRRLLGVFVAAAAYGVAVLHLTSAYFARQAALERFLLVDGGAYPLLYWLGFAGLGTIAPLALLFGPKVPSPRTTVAAAALVVAGGFAFLYAFIIGGQAWPLEIFPGYAASSSFGDGQVAAYAPSLPELLLGLGGLGIAFTIGLVGLRVLPFAPAPAGAATAKGAPAASGSAD